MGNGEPKATKKTYQKPLSTRYTGNLLRKECINMDHSANKAEAKVFITEEKKVKKRKVNALLANVPIACLMKQFNADHIFNVTNSDQEGAIMEMAREEATIGIYYPNQEQMIISN